MDGKHWPGVVWRRCASQNTRYRWDGAYRDGAGAASALWVYHAGLHHARRRHQEAEDRFNARYCDLDTLLQEADFVCVILPLTAETRHLFGATQFARMKSSAIFINAGRGPVVDENALIAALQNGEIYAAGLDVFEHEPLSVDSPLLNMSNVVAVPHIGSATHETRYNMMACAVDNLIDALQGKIEKNCVNPQTAG